MTELTQKRSSVPTVRWGRLLILAVFLLSACGLRPPEQGDLTPVTDQSAVPTLQSTASGVVPVDETPVLPPDAEATSPPPQVPGASIFGMEIHRPIHVAPAAALQTYWVRHNALVWSKVEPEKGARRWEEVKNLETQLAETSAQGMESILIVRGTPYWARKVAGFGCGPVKHEEFAAFASFLADTVARYSAPPYNVKYWELGNEPDVDPALVTGNSVFGCWGDPADPYFGGGFYAEMLKAVYPVIKQADPQAQVLIGGLLLICDPASPPETQPGSGQFTDCSPAKFFEGILVSGGGDFFDGVSFHAYDYYWDALGHSGNGLWASSWKTSGPVLVNKARHIRGLLETYGHPEKYLINTEVGLICGSGQEPKCSTPDFYETKGMYIVQAYATALAEGLLGNVWYSITGWRATGLVTKELQPVPGYESYLFATVRFDQAVFVQEITSNPGLRIYEFARGDARMWVVWALDDEVHALALPEAPDAVYLYNGTPVAAEQTLQVNFAPLYIEWLP